MTQYRMSVGWEGDFLDKNFEKFCRKKFCKQLFNLGFSSDVDARGLQSLFKKGSVV